MTADIFLTMEGNIEFNRQKYTDELAVITDSTAVVEVAFIVKNDRGHMLDDEELFDEVEAIILRFAKSQPGNDLLDQALDVTKRFQASFLQFSHAVDGVKAKYAFFLGGLYEGMKNIVSKEYGWGHWLKWAEKNNLPKDRYRQIYQRFYRTRHYSEKYAFVGVFRLDRLLAATKNIPGDDPIYEFLVRHGIKIGFDEQGIVDDPALRYKDFTGDIDAALVMEMLEKRGVTDVRPECIREIIGLVEKISKSFVTKLKNVQDAGNDVNNFLNDYIINCNASPSQDQESHPRRKGFNFSSAQLIDLMNHILNEPIRMEFVDRKIAAELKEVVNKFVTALEASHKQTSSTSKAQSKPLHQAQKPIAQTFAQV